MNRRQRVDAAAVALVDLPERVRAMVLCFLVGYFQAGSASMVVVDALEAAVTHGRFMAALDAVLGPPAQEEISQGAAEAIADFVLADAELRGDTPPAVTS